MNSNTNTTLQPNGLLEATQSAAKNGDEFSIALAFALLRRRHRERADVREKIVELAERRLASIEQKKPARSRDEDMLTRPDEQLMSVYRSTSAAPSAIGQSHSKTGSKALSVNCAFPVKLPGGAA